VSSSTARSEPELSPEDEERLREAHRRLREAVAAYEAFLGRELKPGEPVPVHQVGRTAEAQVTVEEAERELWRLREDLLGWVRPPWAPGAAHVADWFSDEDAIYDDISVGSEG
jgi:hypothetical protein